MKTNDLITKLHEIVMKNSNGVEEIDFDNENLSLEEIGYDSIAFVELIVDLEDAFNIEFKNEDLLVDKIMNYKELENLLLKYYHE